MRSQTITAPSDGQEWVARPVDPTGWLAGPSAWGGVPPVASPGPGVFGLSGQVGVIGTDGHPVGDADTSPARRSGDRRARTGERTVRRSARGRHLRRVRAESDRLALAERADSHSSIDTAPSEGVPSGAAQSDVWQIADIQIDSAPQEYRMGRWSRLALTVTVLAAVVVVAVLLTAGPATRSLVDVTVGPGDTLWSIATQAAPDRDPRDVIDEIRQLNNMKGTVLPIGVVLRVPQSTE